MRLFSLVSVCCVLIIQSLPVTEGIRENDFQSVIDIEDTELGSGSENLESRTIPLDNGDNNKEKAKEINGDRMTLQPCKPIGADNVHPQLLTVLMYRPWSTELNLDNTEIREYGYRNSPFPSSMMQNSFMPQPMYRTPFMGQPLARHYNHLPLSFPTVLRNAYSHSPPPMQAQSNFPMFQGLPSQNPMFYRSAAMQRHLPFPVARF